MTIPDDLEQLMFEWGAKIFMPEEETRWLWAYLMDRDLSADPEDVLTHCKEIQVAEIEHMGYSVENEWILGYVLFLDIKPDIEEV